MTGKMIAMAATDCEYFEIIIMPLFIPICPVVFVFSTIIIFLIIGPVGLLAIATMLIYLFLLSQVGEQTRKYRMKIASQTDLKTKTLNSLIEAVRIIKMYAWELDFKTIIEKFRANEIVNEKKVSYFFATYSSIFVAGHGLVLFITFAVYISLGNELTPSIAFSTMSIVYTTQMAAVGFASFGFQIMNMLFASSKRITDVLLVDTHDDDYAIRGKSDNPLELRKLSAYWSKGGDGAPQVTNMSRTRTSTDMTFDTLVDIDMTIRSK